MNKLTIPKRDITRAYQIMSQARQVMYSGNQLDSSWIAHFKEIGDLLERLLVTTDTEVTLKGCNMKDYIPKPKYP